MIILPYSPSRRELQATLEEHQSALELIMQKYREHTVKLLQSNRLERALNDKEVADKVIMTFENILY